MKQYLIAAILALALSSARATDVYWVNKDNQILKEWHIDDGETGWFQSEDKGRCLAEVKLLKLLAETPDAGDDQ